MQSDNAVVWDCAGTDARATAADNSSSMPVVTAMRSAKYGSSSSNKASNLSSTLAPTAALHNTGPMQSPSLPSKPTVGMSQHLRSPEATLQAGSEDLDAQAGAPGFVNAADPGVANDGASASAADGVAELRRTDQHGDAGFEAAQKEEWERRQIEIQQQAVEARRQKRLRKAQNEKLKQQQVWYPVSLHCF